VAPALDEFREVLCCSSKAIEQLPATARITCLRADGVRFSPSAALTV
jgi:hypothetical protein